MYLKGKRLPIIKYPTAMLFSLMKKIVVLFIFRLLSRYLQENNIPADKFVSVDIGQSVTPWKALRHRQSHGGWYLFPILFCLLTKFIWPPPYLPKKISIIPTPLHPNLISEYATSHQNIFVTLLRLSDTLIRYMYQP